MSEILKVDREYLNWISDIALRFKQSQIKAANKVNVEMLRFYWSLGKDIFEKMKVINMALVFIKR